MLDSTQQLIQSLGQMVQSVESHKQQHSFKRDCEMITDQQINASAFGVAERTRKGP
jgi:hypothetical protein